MLRKPLARKRATPRRNAGRITHDRIRPKASAGPTADDRRYWDSLPDRCWCCGTSGTVIHHILANAPGKQGRRDHLLISKLCPQCHNLGTFSVHLLGSEAEVMECRGVDLVGMAVAKRDEWINR